MSALGRGPVSELIAAGTLLVALACSGCGTQTQQTSRNRQIAPGSLLTAPSPGGPLAGVYCVNDHSCWAVGRTGGATPGAHPLIEGYRGTAWTAVAGSDGGAGGGGALAGVSCINATDCSAVGRADVTPQSGPQALLEHYDGSGWSVRSGGLPGGATLTGISCTGAGECWAVGHSGPAPGERLVAQYTGGRWSAANGAGRPGDGSTLRAVWCRDPDTCWAVGSTGVNQTLTEQYDGGSWTEVPSGDNGDAATLSGVSCSPAGACWAVGSSARAGVQRPLIEHYTGIAWMAVDSPIPAFSRAGSLGAVTCLSDADCWAMGAARSAAGVDQGLAEQFNGAGWSVTRTPLVTGATFNGVTCPEDDDCFVVGGHGQASLIELYDLILPEGH